MRFIKDYYRQRGLRSMQLSTKRPVTAQPFVTLLCDNDLQFELLKESFTKLQGVYTKNEVRLKDKAVNSAVMFTNDFSWKGVPIMPLPEVSVSNHIVINVSSSTELAWYWYARSYEFRIDMMGVYPDADLSIVGENALEEKIETMRSYLNKMSHE